MQISIRPIRQVGPRRTKEREHLIVALKYITMQLPFICRLDLSLIKCLPGGVGLLVRGQTIA